jgi:Type II CAAX prenyl endopeptidase Rce1-like
MHLLSARFEPAAGPAPSRALRLAAPAALAAALVVAVGQAGDRLAVLPAGLGHALASGAVHGGLLATGWLVATEAAAGWPGPVVRLGAVALAAPVAAWIGPWGALGFLAVPVALLAEARGRPALRAIGVGRSRPGPVVAGLAAGAFIGAHLLLTASLTLGYRVHPGGLAAYAGALAYDVGANALSAEWLFRGALFSRWWRRGTFWPAALATTALALARYLLDPALPRAAEARAGAVFYLALVGLTACGLRAWSGSLLPGYLVTLAFFAAYRALAP